MKSNVNDGRRDLIVGLVSVAGLGLAGCKEREAEVTPGEDLMQEHGILERVMLIYDEGAARIDRNEQLDAAAISGSAQLVQRFIEGYHEKNEESFVFPRMQKANVEVDLVATLLRQHQAGRKLTASILDLTKGRLSGELAAALRAFVRMYRPHAAREETVLIPSFRALVGRHGYEELGEQFEEDEHKRFGAHGFEDAVKEVSRLEAALGIADLTGFTPV
jgi:hemerythrin-like domain-containing protein